MRERGIIVIIPKWHTAREHVIGKSEVLNILSARRFLLQLKIGWRGVLELAGLFRLRTRTFEAKNCQAVSADAVLARFPYNPIH